MNKLGSIDYQPRIIYKKEVYHPKGINLPSGKTLIITNCYTQFDITGRKVGKMDLDYAALELCLKKMNHVFKGRHIGLPLIGCHLAGGDWNIVKKMIQEHLKNCKVTVVFYKP